VDTHHVLIIGVGSIGERHLRCFGKTKRAEMSLVETNEQTREAVADRYAVKRSYASLDDALNDRASRFDVAVVATPAQLHIPMATQLAEAGIHLFIEKPLSTSLDGIDGLMKRIEQRQLKAAVAYTFRSHPVLQSMKQAIDEGRFGRPVQFVATFGQHYPSFRPTYRDIYYARWATGGGAIQDALTHVINAAEFFLGPTDRLMADAANQMLEGVEVEDTVHAITRHGDAMACCALNQYQAPNEGTVTIVCEHGTARFELQNSRWRSMTKPGSKWKTEFSVALERDDIYINQANTFLDYLEGKQEPTCTLAEGLQTLRVNLALLAEMRQPRWRLIGPDH
jgi:predicted dehydrogenase